MAALFFILSVGTGSAIGFIVAIILTWMIEAGHIKQNGFIQTRGYRSMFRDIAVSFAMLGAMLGMVIGLMARVMVMWELQWRGFTNDAVTIESISALLGIV